MSLALWVGIFTIGGIILTVLISVMTGAFIAGKHSNRIDNLEVRQKEIEDEAKQARVDAAKSTAQMAGFEAKLTALSQTVQIGFEEIKGAIRDLAESAKGRRRSMRDDI